MPVTVTRLENEPILIATFTGAVTSKDIVELFYLSNELIHEDEETIYRITDARNGTSNFIEMLAAIREVNNGLPGSTADPRIRATFVGTSTWITFARNAMKHPQFGGMQLAAFPLMEDALASIRYQIEAKQNPKL